MKDYPNFYENIIEARARLRGTIVLYDGVPHTVMAITDHMKDGIFRMYLNPIGRPREDYAKWKPFNDVVMNTPHDYSELGIILDRLLDENPDAGILRKHMNSPFFNRFRPFPLGMCVSGTQTYYVERQPIRPKMEQGLIKSALYESLVTAGSRSDNPRRVGAAIEIGSEAFRDCIMGEYHTPHEVLAALTNPNVVNDSAPFHREFAIVRGPLNMLFLGYRTEIIGVLPKNNFEYLRLGQEFRYCREVVEELRLFREISYI